MAITFCRHVAIAQVPYFPFLTRTTKPKEYEKRWNALFGGKIEVTVANQYGLHPMILAAAQGNIALVRTFSQKDMRVLNLGDNTGWTPLFYAVFANHFQTVDTLFDLGADMNTASIHFWDTWRGIVPEGATSLWIAAKMTSNVAMTKLLLNYGALVAPELDADGKRILEIAKNALTAERKKLTQVIDVVVKDLPPDLLQVIIEYV